MLVVAIFLLLIVINFESLRNIKQTNLIGMQNVHTEFVKVKEEVFDILEKDAVIIFTSKNTDSKKVKQALYSAALINNYGTIYEVDLTEEELVIELIDNKDVNIVKKSTEFYNKLISKLGLFSEIYAIKNQNGEYVNTGYQKIYTPFVVYIKDGKILYSYYLHESEELTDKELKDIYSYGFNLLKDENA